MDGLVCVTGAGGYIGSHVVEALRARGAKVRGLVRDPADMGKVGHLAGRDGVELVGVDLLAGRGLDRAMEGCDLVVHSASTVRLVAKDPQREIVDVACGITRNVLEAAARAGSVRRVVVTSSIAAVGDETRRAGHVSSEDDWNEHATLGHDPYPLSKVLAEKEALRIHASLPESERFELVALHPGFVLGPVLGRVHLRSSPSMVRRMLAGRIPACPAINLSVVDVREVAEAHARALEVERPASRTILTGQNIWMQDMAVILKRNFPDHPVPTRRLPAALAYAGALIGKDVSMHFLKHNLGKQRVFDNRRAREELGIVFRPVEETIVDTARSIIHGGWL